MTSRARSFVLSCCLFLASSTFAVPKVTELRLYALDCGHMHFKSLTMFSDTGDLDAKSGDLVDTCYLIAHPTGGWLLWDTGFGDAMYGKPNDIAKMGVHVEVPKTIVSQLEAVGLKPADITFVAFSHMHPDHTGNANLFSTATWLLQKKELDWATAPETAAAGKVVPATFSAYKTAKLDPLSGDHDVFGDGSVVILSTPGHTPGHQSLMVKLPSTGVVVLSGDLYHLYDNYTHGRVPGFNFSRAETLASENRVENILKNTHGKLVVQHDAGSFASLPKFPQYLK